MLVDQKITLSARNRKKLSGELLVSVIEKLKERWSPDQISGWLKLNNQGLISHESIYRHIWEEKRKGGKLYLFLRRRGKKYKKRGSKIAGRGCIPNRVDIAERPEVVEKKERLGDWELDTIIGAQHKGVIVSMVDRASKYTMLVLLGNRKSKAVTEALIKRLCPIKKSVLTLTSDNGKEFAKHKDVSFLLGAGFYFAKPYRSWERGLNEHTNGLVRQYFPKKSRFDKLSKKQVAQVEKALNTRPRKVLGYRTPIEVFSELREAS